MYKVAVACNASRIIDAQPSRVFIKNKAVDFRAKNKNKI